MVDPNEDTEFNDALRAYGVLPPRAKTPETASPPRSPSLRSQLDSKTTDELDDLLLEELDDERERFIIEYRQQKIAELKREQNLARFGSVLPISREDYTKEVPEASKVDEDDEGKGTGVICFLYKEGLHPPSVRLAAHLKTLAANYPRTKVVSIVGDKCIENYPDKMLPTLILYRKGEIQDQLVAWGSKHEGTLQELEAVLIQAGIIAPTKMPSQSTKLTEDVEIPYPRTKIRNSGPDPDSDFEFDL